MGDDSEVLSPQASTRCVYKFPGISFGNYIRSILIIILNSE